jgi:hypothetical protein
VVAVERDVRRRPAYGDRVGSAKSVPLTVVTVPPAAGPEDGVIEKMILCENSDVLPSGSVAVTAILDPSSTRSAA